MDKTIGINTQENDLQIGQTAPDFSEPPLTMPNGIFVARRAFISIENGTINKPIARRALTN